MSLHTSARWFKPRTFEPIGSVIGLLLRLLRTRYRSRLHTIGPLNALSGRFTSHLAYDPPMPRLREIPRAEVESPMVLSMYDRLFGDRDPVAQPGTATGTPGDW